MARLSLLVYVRYRSLAPIHPATPPALGGQYSTKVRAGVQGGLLGRRALGQAGRQAWQVGRRAGACAQADMLGVHVHGLFRQAHHMQVHVQAHVHARVHVTRYVYCMYVMKWNGVDTDAMRG